MNDEATNGKVVLTPAMAAWVEKLEAGYTIRRGTVAHRRSFPRWSWQLFNPEGAFVQTVRSNTVNRLRELGYVGEEVVKGIHLTMGEGG